MDTATRTNGKLGKDYAACYPTKRYWGAAFEGYRAARAFRQRKLTMEQVRLAAATAQGTDPEDTLRVRAAINLGIEVGAESDLRNPIADLDAEWRLAQELVELERGWGLHPAPAARAAQPSCCRHGVLYSATCAECDDDE